MEAGAEQLHCSCWLLAGKREWSQHIENMKLKMRLGRAGKRQHCVNPFFRAILSSPPVSLFFSDCGAAVYDTHGKEQRYKKQRLERRETSCSLICSFHLFDTLSPKRSNTFIFYKLSIGEHRSNQNTVQRGKSCLTVFCKHITNTDI